MTAPNLRPKILACLCLAGVALAWLGREALRLSPADDLARTLNAGALALGGSALLMGFLLLARHFNAENPAHNAAHDGQAEEKHAKGRRKATDDGDGLELRAPAGALRAALRCLDQPALVVSERGRVLYANPAATAFFDPTARPGAPMAEVVDPADWRKALVKARSDGAPARALLRRADGRGDLIARVADLGFQAGAAAVFEADPAAPPLAPPARPGGRWGLALDPAAPLAALPMLALTVTLEQGRVATIATVKISGGRVFPTMSLDFSVAQPDIGRLGRPFAEIWPTLAQAMTGAVVVAADAAGAWAALRREMAAAGFADAGLADARPEGAGPEGARPEGAGPATMEPPPLIDLAALAAKYAQDWADWDLDRLAQALNIAEPDPARRLARTAATLALGPTGNVLGNGLGCVGEFVPPTDKPPEP